MCVGVTRDRDEHEAESQFACLFGVDGLRRPRGSRAPTSIGIDERRRDGVGNTANLSRLSMILSNASTEVELSSKSTE